MPSAAHQGWEMARKTYRYESWEWAFMSNHKEAPWLPVWWASPLETIVNVSYSSFNIHYTRDIRHGALDKGS